VIEEETLILQVTLSEDAEVTWHKDGERVKIDNERISVESKGLVRRLIIKNVTVADEGEYTAHITSSEVESTADIAVRGMVF